MREKDGDRMVGIFNLSNKPQTTQLVIPVKDMKEVFSGKSDPVMPSEEIQLQPWEFLIYSNR